MSSPLAGVAAINAITFGVYGNVVRLIPNPDSVLSTSAAGATAGLVQVRIWHFVSKRSLYFLNFPVPEPVSGCRILNAGSSASEE